MPRRIRRTIAMHITAAADRQHAVTVQRPGQVAAVALSAAGAAGHNVRRQRRGRQDRHDHQHREYETQKSFFHVFPPYSFFSCHFVSSPATQKKRCAWLRSQYTRCPDIYMDYNIIYKICNTIYIIGIGILFCRICAQLKLKQQHPPLIPDESEGDAFLTGHFFTFLQNSIRIVATCSRVAPPCGLR